jgi:hypothetical protein
MLCRAGLAALAPDLRQIVLDPLIHNLAAKYRLQFRSCQIREQMHLHLLDMQRTEAIQLLMLT